MVRAKRGPPRRTRRARGRFEAEVVAAVVARELVLFIGMAAAVRDERSRATHDARRGELHENPAALKASAFIIRPELPVQRDVSVPHERRHRALEEAEDEVRQVQRISSSAAHDDVPARCPHAALGSPERSNGSIPVQRGDGSDAKTPIAMSAVTNAPVATYSLVRKRGHASFQRTVGCCSIRRRLGPCGRRDGHCESREPLQTSDECRCDAPRAGSSLSEREAEPRRDALLTEEQNLDRRIDAAPGEEERANAHVVVIAIGAAIVPSSRDQRTGPPNARTTANGAKKFANDFPMTRPTRASDAASGVLTSRSRVSRNAWPSEAVPMMNGRAPFSSTSRYEAASVALMPLSE